MRRKKADGVMACAASGRASSQQLELRGRVTTDGSAFVVPKKLEPCRRSYRSVLQSMQ